MNYRNRKFRKGLPVCPECGMDSGRRGVLPGNPEKYFVVCESCGFQTRPHPTQSAATREWKERNK